MTLNKSPIFLNCFSRGGSNIFWNLFLSHPELCSPIHETLVIFRADWRAPTAAGLWLALITGQPRLVDQWHLSPRRPVNRIASRFIDQTFFHWKRRTVEDSEMRFKRDCTIYDVEEVEASRLVAKNNNGLAFLTDVLLDIYPDATFFSLVRDPVALFESHLRRKIVGSSDKFVSFFNAVAGEMIKDASRLECYNIVRFEDILSDPIGTTQRVFELAGVDFQRLEKIRFKAKAHFRENGSYGSDLAIGKHHWFSFSQVKGFFEPDVNKIQGRRLDRSEREAVMGGTEAVRYALGYS